MLDLSKYRFVKDLVLDDRTLKTNTGIVIQHGYKPDRGTLDELGRLLPNVRVLGFRKYYLSVWALIVTDPSFEDENFITMTSLKRMPVKPFLRLLP